MKRFFLLFLSLLSVHYAFAEKIYQWKDSDGITHFSQYPPARYPAKLIETYVPHVDAEAHRQQLQKKLEAFNTRMEERKLRKEGGEAAVQYKRKLDQYCKSVRQNLNLLQSGNPVSEAGSDQVLSEAQIQQRIAQLQKQLAEKCQ